MRWHVAGCARVAIGVPHAADGGGFLQDHEIGQTGFLELDAEPNAAKSGPDNHDLRARRTGIDHPASPADPGLDQRSKSPLRRRPAARLDRSMPPCFY